MRTTDPPARLSLADYTKLGGLRRVVHTEIDSILAADPAERRHQLELLRAAFIPWLAGIDPDTDTPVRRRATWTDLPEDSRPLVDRLVDKRLMVKTRRDDGQIVVEVALESLLRQWDQLAGWLADQRQNLKTADDLHRTAAAWRSSGHDPAWLLTGTRLADAETLAATPEFASASRTPNPSWAPPATPKTSASTPRKHRQAELRAAQDRERAAKTASGPPKTASGPPKTASGPHGNFRKPPRRMPPRCANAPKSCAESLAITAIIAVIALIGAVVAVVSSRHGTQRGFCEATSLRAGLRGPGHAGRHPALAATRGPSSRLLAARTLTTPDDGALYSAVVQRPAPEDHTGHTGRGVGCGVQPRRAPAGQRQLGLTRCGCGTPTPANRSAPR